MSNPRPTSTTPPYGGASQYGMRHGGLNKCWMSAIIVATLGLTIGSIGAFARVPVIALGGLGFAVTWCVGLMVLYFKLRYLFLLLAFVASWVGALYAVIYYVI